MYLLLAYLHINKYSDIPPPIHFPFINNISISIRRSNFTLVFFKAGYHANPGTERNFARSGSYILIHIFLKFSNTSASNNVSL